MSEKLTCRECKFWGGILGYGGHCYARLPLWAKKMIEGMDKDDDEILFMARASACSQEDEQAEDCDAYYPRQATKKEQP